MVNRNQKGKRVEREIAKLLTKATGDNWNRVLNSGGYATTTGTEEGRFRGDVFSDDWEDYCIEVKSTKKNISISHFFSRKSRLFKYLNQLIEECGKDIPVLFIKINHRGIYVVYDQVNYSAVEDLIEEIDTEEIYATLVEPEEKRFWKINKIK